MQEKSVRQIEIIEAAGKILATSGVNGLTIRNLAKEMQFAESAIYRHFAGKELIIVAMLEFLAADMAQRHSQIPPNLSPEEKLTAMFANQFSFFEAHPHFATVMFSDSLFETSQQINEKIVNVMAVRKSFLLPVVKQGQADGVFTQKVSADDLVHILMGSVRLLMFKWRVDGFKFDIVKEGVRLVESFLMLIKK